MAQSELATHCWHHALLLQVLEIVKNDKGDSVVSIMPNDSLADMLGTLDEDSVDF